jgi:hypothetical protein
MNFSKLIFWVGLVFTFLMLLSAYAISTNLVFPLGNRSAFYIVPNINDNLPSKSFAVPIEIFIVESANTKVKYSNEDLMSIMNSVNNIWRSNANITFQIIGINHIIVADNRAEPMKTNENLESLGRDFIGEKFTDNTIDVIIVKSLKGSENGGGIAHKSFKAVMENEFENEKWASWNLAHELGHKLNLSDVVQYDNLMQMESPWNIEYKKAYIPTTLTREQVLTSRDWVYKTYCPSDSCITTDL